MNTLSGFTPEQQRIIDEFKHDAYLTDNFYFTGGTALKTAYLHHRESDDLDFFTENPFEGQIILGKVTQWAQKHNFTITFREFEGMRIFELHFASGTLLKVDFVHYPHTRLKPSVVMDGIPVDSMFDIAVNKVICISQRASIKDYIDLYYLLKEYTIWDLFAGAKKKFRVEVEPYVFAADLMYVMEKPAFPRMLQPLTHEELQSFYLDLAKRLGGSAFS